MAYIFKKVNSLFEPADTNAGASNVVAPEGFQATETKQGTNPYQSTFRDYSKMYEANKAEGAGKDVQTGLDKNIAEQNQNMAKSTEQYKGELSGVADKYKYDPNMVQNVTNNFSKLQSILNPTQQQTELSAKSSNTGNFAPDTQGVAQASTTAGLASLLQNQYGTTQGQARLDALLSRGSGAAGESINKNLQDIQAFREQQKQNLQAEDSLRNQFTEAALQNANLARGDLGNQATSYLSQADTDLATNKAIYDQLYGQKQQELTGLLESNKSLTPEQLTSLREAIQQRFDAENPYFGRTSRAKSFDFDMTSADKNTALAKFILSGGAQQTGSRQVRDLERSRGENEYYKTINQYDITPFLVNQMMKTVPSSYKGPQDLNIADYIETPDVYRQEQYVNPEFNQIQALLGGEAKDLSFQRPDNAVTARDAELQQAIDAQRNEYIQNLLSGIQTNAPTYNKANDRFYDYLNQFGNSSAGKALGLFTSGTPQWAGTIGEAIGNAPGFDQLEDLFGGF